MAKAVNLDASYRLGPPFIVKKRFMKTTTTPTSHEARSFELLLANKRVLELMANNRPLQEILDAVVNLIETFASGCKSTLYFIVDGKLTLGAAPSWPEDFVKAVNGCPIGFNQGTCGHAAFTGKRSVSTDVSKDEVWGPFRDWILSYGIRAAWSTPVISETGQVLATVSMCWKEPRVPTEWDFEIVDTATSLMRIAVERKKQEDMIQAQREKLFLSARLATVGEMAAGLAHEISNPLLVIQGHSHLIQVSSADEKVKRSATHIEKTVNRINGIIKGLKSLSRKGESDPFKKIELNELIEESLSFCRDRFEKDNVALLFDRSKEGIFVDCRPVQISQAIVNLVSNAFDAVISEKVKWVRVEAVVKQETFHVLVTDSGPGVPAEIREKIMDPFFTTKEDNKGTGLGLSISRKILEDHGGRLRLRTDLPQTTFEIVLPVKQPVPVVLT